MGKHWLVKDDQYVRKWYHRKVAEEIGRVLHRSTFAVRTRAIDLGCSKPPHPMTHKEKAYILRSYKNIPISKIAKRLNRAPMRIYELLKKEGLSAPAKRPWTNRENKLLKQLYGKFAIKQLAAQLDRTAVSLYVRAKVLDLTGKHR